LGDHDLEIDIRSEADPIATGFSPWIRKVPRASKGTLVPTIEFCFLFSETFFEIDGRLALAYTKKTGRYKGLFLH
jgi:hypothetical protein